MTPKHAHELADAVTTREAARLLGCTTRFIRILLTEGHIKGFRLTPKGHHRIALDEINRLRRGSYRMRRRCEKARQRKNRQ
ncbi:MAG: helix-turn-helix domain-containing protein [Armatimonadota bacterium]